MITELMNIFKSREQRILYDKDVILMILKIKLQNTSLNANHAEKTKFREINNTIK